jgi:hypothetical protein
VSLNVGGQNINGSAIGVLKGTIFFGFSSNSRFDRPVGRRNAKGAVSIPEMGRSTRLAAKCGTIDVKIFHNGNCCGFSDVVKGNAAPTGAAVQSETTTVFGRLP